MDKGSQVDVPERDDVSVPWVRSGTLEGGPEAVACDRDRALVVDDEKAIVKLFGSIINMEIPGLAVDVASNGLEALDSFSSRHQGLLIMDIHMPVMDGEAAFREIERVCREKNWIMPSIVFCTGYAPPALVKEVVSSGAGHGLLRKPAGYKDIVDAVRARLNRGVA